ncbi:LLM class flavin-dependent oxidoreductase [Corynebacterium nuruki]|uniref:LLM class flavin-dependent oxidoreductase n=1 Tax=Corynebacterium nuruki TaxID=1032851 RepID=UPI0039BFB123
MTDLTLHWFLPPFLDSRHVSGGGPGGLVTGPDATNGDRAVDLNYLRQLALAAEHNGFESVLVPVGLWCEDPWVVASALVDVTEKLKFLVAVRPGVASALKEAQSAATFQNLSGGRLAINLVTGGEPAELAAYGDGLDKAQRYARTGEYVDLWKRLWNEPEPVTFDGEYVHAAGALLPVRPEVDPPIYFAGTSPAAVELSGRRAETYLTWGEPPAAVGEKLSAVRAEAASRGRMVRGGLRVHVIARPTGEEAWRVAAELLENVSPEAVAAAQEKLAASESESQRRISELHGRGAGYEQGGDPHDLEVYPGLWTGVGLVRGGAGTALVGSYDEVAALIGEYAAQGVDELVLSGYPHLEETFHVGQGLVPALRRRGFGVTNHGPAFAEAGATAGATA